MEGKGKVGWIPGAGVAVRLPILRGWMGGLFWC